jgi:hypothetical protein
MWRVRNRCYDLIVILDPGDYALTTPTG